MENGNLERLLSFLSCILYILWEPTNKYTNKNQKYFEVDREAEQNKKQKLNDKIGIGLHKWHICIKKYEQQQCENEMDDNGIQHQQQQQQ